MKRLFKGIAAAGISLTMLAGNTLHMFAVETPTTQKTTAGIQLATSRAKDGTDITRIMTLLLPFPKTLLEMLFMYILSKIFLILRLSQATR